MPLLRQTRAAFTLIELLVVIAIIALLIGLIFTLMPAFLKKGNLVKSLNNMRQVANGFMMYAGDNNGRFPNRPVDGDGANRWPKLINQYITDARVFAAPDDPRNYIKANLDPVSNGTNNTSYIMNGGLDPGTDQGDAAEKPLVLASIDQPSQTILLGCIFDDPNFFLDVENGDQDLIDPKQFGKANCYVFMDGSARSLEEDAYREMNNQNGSDAYLWLINKDADK